MFGKNKTMKSVISSFTAEAKAIAATQQEVAANKQAEILKAQKELDVAVAEIKAADAFIENMTALCCPAVKPAAVAVEVK